jgi:hypothetical protein
MSKTSIHIDNTIRYLPKDYLPVEAHVAGGEACGVWWPLELYWRERKLLAGSPKTDRSKGRSQIKWSPMVLQVGGLSVVLTTVPRKKFLVTKPQKVAKVLQEL